MISIKDFTKKYIDSIRDGNAAVFAGAGLSRPSGYVDWRGLVKPLSEEIGLDIDRENDLLETAQYYKNEKGGNSGEINQTIVDAFGVNSMMNENVDILTRLPIDTYWTTNYDQLLECGLQKAGRKSDVKSEKDQMSYVVKNRDAIVYKMHGDVMRPATAVLTKDDYVLYEKNRGVFRVALQGDLISKTFLFIGFSFEDPNLEYILNRVKILLDGNVKTHYCFFKKINKSDYVSDDEYMYHKTKQELKEKDLVRYGIETILVDEYSQITEILKAIEAGVKKRNIFISGSADDYGRWSRNEAETFCEKLARKLVDKDYHLISGFGKGIGTSVVKGALDEIYCNKYRHTDEYLTLRPFPYEIKDPIERKEMLRKYRQEMLEPVGICIVVFGNKYDSEGKVVDASGCMEEIELVRENGGYIIPVKATGFVAEKIWNQMKAEDESFEYIDKEDFEQLANCSDIDILLNTIMAIVGKIQGGEKHG